MSRRLFLCLLLAGFALLSVACRAAPNAGVLEESGQANVIEATTDSSVGGYTSKVSVAPGESLDFHISNGRSGPYSLSVYREGAARQLMTTIPNVRSENRNCAGRSETGCGWPVAATFTVPADWPSGAYTVDIPRADGRSARMLFFVREHNPGATARILFLASVNTYHAYNDFGGGSLYGFGVTEKVQRVSFDRPYNGNGTGLYQRWESHFVEWADTAGYDVAYATTYDLEFMPNLLSPYDVVIIAGHSEYWTWDMRQRVKEFVARGGRFLNLSGNTMWWQVRFEDNGRTMMGYKNWREDPNKTRQGSTDVNWDYPIFDTSFTFTGLHWPYGGYPGGNGDGYYAVNADHWIYNGAEVRENELFGLGPTADTSINDKESDGLAFNCAADGSTILGPISGPGTPKNFTILGLTTVYSKQRDMDGVAMMGLYTNPAGGAVFSAGTTGWVLGLYQPEVDRITRNVIDRFLSGNFPKEPAAPDADVFFRDRFNCHDLSRGRFTNMAWEGDAPKLNYVDVLYGDANRLTTACGREGSGLDMKMERNTRYISNLTADWSGTDALYTGVYLNLSRLTLGEGATFNLFQQYADARNGEPAPVTTLQVGRRAGKVVARYGPASANLDWTPVPDNKFFLLETYWDQQAGQVSLSIDGARKTLNNVDLRSAPKLNRADFGVMNVAGSVGGALCLDELVYDLTAEAPPPPDPVAQLYLSFAQDGASGGLAFADEDILHYDPQSGSWALFFDGSDVGLGASDVDAFVLLPDGSLLLSVDKRLTNLVPLGRVEDADVVRFVPTALGDNTAGRFEWYLDGSDVDLLALGEDIDALDVLPDGRLLISTVSAFAIGRAPNVLKGTGHDLLALTPTQTGANSAGQWALYLDGSDVGLTLASENIDAVWARENEILLSATGAAAVADLAFGPADLARCVPSALGSVSACTFELFWSAYDLPPALNVDGLHVQPPQ